jgi:hypothetical protein
MSKLIVRTVAGVLITLGLAAGGAEAKTHYRGADVSQQAAAVRHK